MTNLPAELQELLNDLRELIRIDSSQGEAKKGRPYGDGPYEALMWMLNKGEEYGFRTKNVDGYCGYMEVGEGSDMIGILGHLDVVPAGDGWETPPFEMVYKDGKIYGRGTLDDKGPVITVMHVVREIAAEQKLNKRIRLILGTNEENVWDDIEYYKAHEEIPTLGFTPDGNFPVIFAEKGILDFSLSGSASSNDGTVRIISCEGGISRNSVAEKCTICIDLPEGKKDGFIASLDNKDGITAFAKDDIVHVTAYGKAFHCQNPENGINAISKLMVALAGSLQECELPLPQFVEAYMRRIGNGYYGEKFGCAMEDAPSGKLIFNVGLINMAEDTITIEISVRYPVTAEVSEITESIIHHAETTGLQYKQDDHVAPIYKNTDEEFIRILIGAYREVTGDYNTEPMMVGGGTYARTLPNCVAFGPAMPDDEEVAHLPNEYVEVGKMLIWKSIYKKALTNLLQIK